MKTWVLMGGNATWAKIDTQGCVTEATGALEMVKLHGPAALKTPKTPKAHLPNSGPSKMPRPTTVQAPALALRLDP